MNSIAKGVFSYIINLNNSLDYRWCCNKIMLEMLIALKITFQINTFSSKLDCLIPSRSYYIFMKAP